MLTGSESAFPEPVAALEEFPEPVAVVEERDGDVTTRATNEAFDDTFGETTEELIHESLTVATEDGDPTEPVPGGPITVESGSGPQEFRVTYVPIEDGETTVGGGRESSEAEDVGYLLWTAPPADLRGKDRFVELHGTTRRMLTAESREAVAEIAANAVGNVIGFPLNTVRLYDPEDEQLLPTAVSTPTKDITPGSRPAYDRGETIQWEAFDEGEFLVFQDISKIDDDVQRTGSGSMLVAPLDEHGVLTMGTTEHSAITDTDVEIARVFAANVEVAMDRIERLTTLRERERELERQNERLDRFASVLSHDLRNPISIASGYAEIAQKETESDEMEEYLDEVLDAVERMSTLVDQTLTLAREGDRVDEVEPVCVPGIAERLTNVKTGTDPTLVFPDDDERPPEWTVAGDDRRIERLLENLLRNAVEHCGDGVTVRVGRLDDGEGFYVADDGPGIPPDHREEVFEYGTSYDDGTGLGLAIVSELTAAHGWDVEITDSWADGARFEFDTSPAEFDCAE